jgi:hypothetical protein
VGVGALGATPAHATNNITPHAKKKVCTNFIATR